MNGPTVQIGACRGGGDDPVVDLITQRLEPGGLLVVTEGAWERFDEATARWSFDRLADDEPGWLHRRRDEWLTSGQSWDVYLDRWARSEALHTGQDILRSLATRFDTRLLAEGTFLFPDLELGIGSLGCDPQRTRPQRPGSACAPVERLHPAPLRRPASSRLSCRA